MYIEKIIMNKRYYFRKIGIVIFQRRIKIQWLGEKERNYGEWLFKYCCNEALDD